MPDETPNAPVPVSGAERLAICVETVRTAATTAVIGYSYCFAGDDPEGDAGR